MKKKLIQIGASIFFTTTINSLFFLNPDDPFLKKGTLSVQVDEIKSLPIQTIIDEMIDIARIHQIDMTKRFIVGLAAPQLGIDKRIILVDIGIAQEKKELGKWKAYINPKIIWQSPEKKEARESCYSIDNRLAGILSRPYRIKITAFDRNGNQIIEEFSDIAAKVFQHEIDHLEGICFPDLIGENGILHWVEENEYPAYRIHWQNWHKKCPWHIWLAMKEGQSYQNPQFN